MSDRTQGSDINIAAELLIRLKKNVFRKRG